MICVVTVLRMDTTQNMYRFTGSDQYLSALPVSRVASSDLTVIPIERW